MERIEKDFKETVAASRKVAQRDQRDAELLDREQASRIGSYRAGSGLKTTTTVLAMSE